MATEALHNVKSWIGENHAKIGIVVGGIYVTFKVGVYLTGAIFELKRRHAIKKWENAPKDVVIFHTMRRGIPIPNVSPFQMKLETYLRMAKIPYKVDFETPFGPTNKTPWITLNGEHFGDTQIIINMLRKKYNIKLGNYSEEEEAIGKATRIMVEDHIYWGGILWRYVYSKGVGIEKIFDIPAWKVKLFFGSYMVNKYKQFTYAQGLGRHSPEQVMELMMDAIKSLSLILGNKKFILGDEPSEWDASIFGLIAQALYTTPGSPYYKFMTEEAPNLHSYCLRMKERFWPDWDQCLARSSK